MSKLTKSEENTLKALISKLNSKEIPVAKAQNVEKPIGLKEETDIEIQKFIKGFSKYLFEKRVLNNISQSSEEKCNCPYCSQMSDTIENKSFENINNTSIENRVEKVSQMYPTKFPYETLEGYKTKSYNKELVPLVVKADKEINYKFTETLGVLILTNKLYNEISLKNNEIKNDCTFIIKQESVSKPYLEISDFLIAKGKKDSFFQFNSSISANEFVKKHITELNVIRTIIK